MNQRLTRRRFGQLAIAGTAVAGLSYLADKTFAQTPNLIIVGVRPGLLTSTDTAAITEVDSTEVDSTEVDSTTAPSSTSITRGLGQQSLNVVAGQVETLTTPQVLQDGVSILETGDVLTGFTSLLDGTLVLAITPASTSKKGGDPTRLIFLTTSPTTVTVSGLNQQEALESVLGTNDGGLLGLVAKKNGTPPVSLVDINPQTGAISFTEKVKLPDNQRYSNLAQCPDGKIYTTAVDKQGTTSLVQLDLGQKQPNIVAQLSFNGSAWNNGFQSLVCSAAGQLLAFGARRYETPNYLHTVDVSTGAITRLTSFDVTKITIARVRALLP